jgi:hypothetical protein
MKKIIEFEGYVDQEPGWEFDMPIYMVNPVLGYTEWGNAGAADNLVEDYLIDLSLKQNYSDAYEPECTAELISIKSTFTRAKKGTARDGIIYWHNTVEIDDEDEEYYRDVVPMEELDGHRNSKSKIG